MLKRILLLSLFGLVSVWAQFNDPLVSSRYLPWYADSAGHQLNFYDLAANPAALFENEQGRSLWVGHLSDGAGGSYHGPFNAGSYYAQNYFVHTVYPLSPDDLFRGYFTFNRKVDREVRWVIQDRYLDWNPILLADSSTGDFSRNGLSWGTEWAHRVNQNWLIGAGFSYNVDQRLKEVFPKPLDKHRDVQFKLGTQIKFGLIGLGLDYRYLDQQEKIEITRYSLEQGRTPTLYKFHYVDLPFIENGKSSEERDANWITQAIGLQVGMSARGWTGLATATYKALRGTTADGGARKQDQGSVRLSGWKGQLLLNRKWQRISAHLLGRARQLRMSARHAEFDLSTIEMPHLDYLLQAGLLGRYSSRLRIYGDMYFTFRNELYQDRMTVNSWQFDKYGLGGKLGMGYQINHSWITDIWTGYINYGYKQVGVETNRYSYFHDILFNARYSYRTGHDSNALIGGRLRFCYLPVLELDLTANWYRMRGNGHTRDIWQAGFVLRLYKF